MTTIFRDRVLNASNGPFDLKFVGVQDIFHFNEPPYICTGSTGGGKTTMAIDIIFKFGKEASRVYYISATKAAIDEQAIETIPEVCRRTPTYENLSSVWNEIKTTCQESKKPAGELMNLLPKFYSSNDVQSINSVISKKEKELLKNGADKQSVAAWKLEVVTRLILDGVSKKGHRHLTIEELTTVTNLTSTQQKTILILDDVSSELSQLKSAKSKVMVDGKSLSMSEAYKAVLTDILTKARHYNCICVIFIHDWNLLEGKSQATNFIMLDSTAVSSIANKRSVSNVVVEKAKICSHIVFDPMYKYHFLVIKNNGDQVFVSKADLHEEQELELDDLNMKLLQAYNNVKLGLTDAPMDDDVENDDEKVEEDNNDSESEDDDEDENETESEDDDENESEEDEGLDGPIV